MSKRLLLVPLALLLVLSMLLGACASAATEAPAEEAPTEEAPVEEAPAEETSVEEAPAAETVMKLAISTDPDTLDPHLTGAGISSLVMGFVGISLIYVDDEGIYYPYLAESWDVSEDGLTYTFHLRTDVTFHNGDPVTAQDVAFTYTRALDPELASPAAGPMLGSVTEVVALDDATVQFTLAAPYYPFLFALSDPSYLMVMSQSYVEEMGEDLGRHPMSAGRYIFSEWITGEKVVLERNPDFNWGPACWQNTGPWAIDNLSSSSFPSSPPLWQVSKPVRLIIHLSRQRMWNS